MNASGLTKGHRITRLAVKNTGTGAYIEDIQRYTMVEFMAADGTLLFQVSVDTEAEVPTLSVRAVEGVHVNGVYHGGALSILPEVANRVSLALRRHASEK